MDVVTPNDRLDAGDKIHYTFTVTNTGNATLTNVAVTEYNSSVTIDNGGVIGTLAIGATVILTGTYTLTQADIDAGTFTNTASVTGKCRNIDYTDEDMDVQILEQIPELLVTKTAAESSYASLGDVLHYTITVANTGNVTIINIEVTDDLTGGEWTIDELGPNAIYTVTTTYTITEADLVAGSVVNNVTASGEDPNGEVLETTT